MTAETTDGNARNITKCDDGRAGAGPVPVRNPNGKKRNITICNGGRPQGPHPANDTELTTYHQYHINNKSR